MAADSYDDVAKNKDSIPELEVAPQDLYHAKSFWTKYIFCQDAKVIGIQYALTAAAIGMVGLVSSWLMRMQIAFPGVIPMDPAAYYQLCLLYTSPSPRD